MPNEELTKPLGLIPRPRARRQRPILFAGLALVAVGVVAGGIWLARGPGPAATATIAAAPAAAAPVDTATLTASIAVKPVPPASAIKVPAPASAPPVPAVKPGLIEVTPSGTLSDVGQVIITDPTRPAPIALPATPDASLLESSPYGPLPRTAANGLRPLDAYARPPQSDGGTRIAIVVGGVGLDPASTRDAINALPGAVTLALAPYGANLRQTLTDARSVGHELLLQIPLEPYGYPKTDPGPHTLTSTAPLSANLDDLSWLLSRATNYVGVENYMGAAFTSAIQPLSALLDAIGKRGLMYLDDGSSPRSLASDVAPGRAPFLRADIVLDPDLNPAAIDARLDQLVAIARQRGFAIATATAFPASIERIAAFARSVKGKDITLVPLSALVAASRT